MSPEDDVLLTLDVDWAPDFVIEDVLNILTQAKVRSTWFLTHMIAPLARMRQDKDLFELGLHPNFHMNSTQGACS